MAKIQIKKDVILVKSESKKDTLQCLSISGYSKLFDDVFEYPHHAIMPILRNFYGIGSLVELKQKVEEGKMPEALYKIALKYDEQFDMTENLKRTGPIDSDDTFLFKHQQLCRQIALLNETYAFFLETGTGKTPLSLQIISDDLLLNPQHRWLVVCPLSLINPAWINDCKRFFPYMKIVNLHGNTPAQTKLAYKTPANVYVVNYESFKNNYDQLVQFGFTGMIVDESSKLKNNSSGITKDMLKFSKTVKRRYILSGTPAPNSMLEYFPQLKFIDEKLLGTSFTSFKAKWFYSFSKGGFEAYDILPEKKEELIQIIKQKAIFISKKDCLDLPAIMPDMIREIEMPADLNKAYKQMKNELFAEIETEFGKKNVLAASAVTSLQKLNQLTSGILMDEHGAIHRISNARLNMLKEVLEELGPKQVIIWANYHGEFQMIQEALGDNCVSYYGGTTKQEVKALCDKHFGAGAFEEYTEKGQSFKDIAVELFKKGKVQYFVANPQSAAYGLTLTNASTTIYYGLTYSYEQHAQSRDRTNRYGQTESCTYMYLMMKNTIDYTLYKVLRDKGDLLSSVLDHLKPESIGG